MNLVNNSFIRADKVQGPMQPLYKIAYRTTGAESGRTSHQGERLPVYTCTEVNVASWPISKTARASVGKYYEFPADEYMRVEFISSGNI